MEGPMKKLFDPAGKVALVTGGTSGLGHAIAEAFLQNGVDVAVCSRHPESAPELAELAAAEGRRYLPVYCDITKEEDVEKMGDIIEKELGPVTMLVNSAGMNILKHAEDYDAESFNKVMSLNVLGTHNVSKMCGKRWMIPAHKGRIVNLSSAKAFLGTDRDYTAYCASKGAINMYTAQLACEWAKFGISVNAIAPTFVVTPINADRLSDPVFYNSLVKRIILNLISFKFSYTRFSVYNYKVIADFFNVIPFDCAFLFLAEQSKHFVSAGNTQRNYFTCLKIYFEIRNKSYSFSVCYMYYFFCSDFAESVNQFVTLFIISARAVLSYIMNNPSIVFIILLFWNSP